jgi:hypothetical protein
MFLCDNCIKDSCEGLHLSFSFGPCEGCGERKETVECVHYKAKRTVEPTIDQVRLRLLEHLRDLVKEHHDEGRRPSKLEAKVECAMEMCRIAGIPDAVIQGYVSKNRV